MFYCTFLFPSIRYRNYKKCLSSDITIHIYMLKACQANWECVTRWQWAIEYDYSASYILIHIETRTYTCRHAFEISIACHCCHFGENKYELSETIVLVEENVSQFNLKQPFFDSIRVAWCRWIILRISVGFCFNFFV